MSNGTKSLTSAYLILYNLIQSVGWSSVVMSLINALIKGADVKGMYVAAEGFTRIFQMISLAEVIHSGLGLVRSSPIMAFTQWAGRSHVLFIILARVEEVQSSLFAPVLLAVWAASEVIRYPWYALSTAGWCPEVLTWLRYTMFIPLYPAGVVCEMALLWLALPTIEKEGRGSIRMPNVFNIGFEYSVFIKVLLLVYLIPWWKLYSSLLNQRAKRLAKDKLD